MSSRRFITSNPGRANKVRTNYPLAPLFEAIINSIQAIDDGNQPRGQIDIEIFRESKVDTLDVRESGYIPAVIGFKITDNGIGFTDPNLDSFCTSDSLYKAKKGGKGIGRFTWLKFFNEVIVESSFRENGGFKKRSFKFFDDGIDSDDKLDSDKKTCGSSVVLTGPTDKFGDKCPKKSEIIAERIIDQFLTLFVTGGVPSINLKDGIETISLNTLYASYLGSKAKQKTITINERTFTCTSLFIQRGGTHNSVLLCGNKRTVLKLPLMQFEPIFAGKMTDTSGRPATYLMFVEGPYLNEIVRDDYSGFYFPDETDGSTDFERNITQSSLTNKLIEVIKSELQQNLKVIGRENIERVKSYIDGKAPRYRYIANKYPEKLGSIIKSSDRDIDSELRKIEFEIETKTRQDAEDIITLISNKSVTQEEIRSKTQSLIDNLNETAKSNLPRLIPLYCKC